MRKRIVLITCIFAVLALLTGCSGSKAKEAVGLQITSIKKNGSKSFSTLLEKGIAQSNQAFVLQFPEELKKPYLEFMQDAFSTITFKVSKASKMNDGTYSVQVSYTPLNIRNTLEASNAGLLRSLETTDLTGAVSSVLTADKDVLKSAPAYDGEITSTLRVSQVADQYTVSTDSLEVFISEALNGIMEPYNQICDVLNSRDFIQAYLDASFKGDIANFARHTKRSEEETLAWYETAFSTPADLSENYTARYKEALKSIMKQCQYTVGIPVKESGVYNYTVDIKTTPNSSFSNAHNEIKSGTYYSAEEVSSGLVQAMEKYAAAPTFNDETTVTISLNASSLLNAGKENSELSTLARTILVAP